MQENCWQQLKPAWRLLFFSLFFPPASYNNYYLRGWVGHFPLATLIVCRQQLKLVWRILIFFPTCFISHELGRAPLSCCTLQRHAGLHFMAKSILIIWNLRKRLNKPTVFKLFPTFILHFRKRKELLKMLITSSSLL